MDGSAIEHSDSDSGESWTLLESGPAYADDAPDFAKCPPDTQGYAAENIDKDEDTDGISIISDSEPESSPPCELSYDKCLLEECRPPETEISEFVSHNPTPLNNNHDHQTIRADDNFLGDNTGKLKTYVHKRNKRLSTVLNIIVLGSVITAAGVAVGHMWARSDCTSNAPPSVNKILSNLYRLQEENAYLRTRVKELTLINNIQMLHRKVDPEKTSSRQHKCKKVFEKSLTNKNADQLLKCVDNETNEKQLDIHVDHGYHDYEKELLSDLDKLKNVYQQNKSWLDEEIGKRIKHEEQYKKRKLNNLKSPKSIRINQEIKTVKHNTLKRQIDVEPPENAETVINVTELVQPEALGASVKEIISEKPITYADSLKSGHKVVKRDTNEVNIENKFRNTMRKKKPPKEIDTISENSLTDDDLKKDDRYMGHKYKPEKKKNDRHKIHKKQKRRNKYEQWEMKGGYLKDYDDFPVPPSHENDFAKNPDKNLLRGDLDRNVINPFSEALDSAKKVDAADGKKQCGGCKTAAGCKREKSRENDLNWYEKRAVLRTEARKKLEQEMFGHSAGGGAQWYFRRMQRREQCRVKPDNATYKRLPKRALNYKTKH